MPNETQTIALDDETSKELQQLQRDVAAAQAAILELSVILAAYRALPTSLQERVEALGKVSQSRDDKLKSVAAASGVDLDAPEEAGRWAWSPAENVLRKV